MQFFKITILVNSDIIFVIIKFINVGRGRLTIVKILLSQCIYRLKRFESKLKFMGM